MWKLPTYNCMYYMKSIFLPGLYLLIYSRPNYWWYKAFVFKFGMNEIKVFSINLTAICELLNMKIICNRILRQDAVLKTTLLPIFRLLQQDLKFFRYKSDYCSFILSQMHESIIKLSLTIWIVSVLYIFYFDGSSVWRYYVLFI